MEESKPCPFCGSKEEFFKDHKKSCWIRIFAEEKDGSRKPTFEEYDDAWNNRYKNLC